VGFGCSLPLALLSTKEVTMLACNPKDAIQAVLSLQVGYLLLRHPGIIRHFFKGDTSCTEEVLLSAV